jgi:hypothetical protein
MNRTVVKNFRIRMCTATVTCAVLALAGGLCRGPIRAAEVIEQAEARTIPWSGYWWPYSQGALLNPLRKYDALSGAVAADWEATQHPAGGTVPAWHGYCHAWAASSVMEGEPQRSRLAGSPQQQVELLVGDQKGLLAVCHALDDANAYGDRYGDGEGNEDLQDLAPDLLWRLLKLYVKEFGVPLIVDLEAGEEVWNFPVYAYRIELQETSDDGQRVANLTLWMADDGVPPNYVGTQVRRHSCQFSYRERNHAVVMGSGRWVGPSRRDHPDFAWYPYVPHAENPEVDYAVVKELVQPDAGQPQPAPHNDPDPQSVPQSDPPSSPSADYDNPPAPAASAGEDAQAPVRRTVISPLELVALIARKTSDFGLDVTVDRFDGGLYEVDDALTVRVTSQRAGYLYLLHITSEGTVSLLYPQPGDDNHIVANQEVFVPGKEQKTTLRVGRPFGTARIKAIVSAHPLGLTGLMPLAQQQAAPAQSPAAENPSTEGVVQLQGFRWHPTQRSLIRDLLLHYQQHEQLTPEQYGRIDPHQVLGPFAQDEVAYYVGPKKGA